MRRGNLIKQTFIGLLAMIAITLAEAREPVWTLSPLTPTALTIRTNETASVKYLVTNQSKKPHTLETRAMQGIAQITTTGNCPNPFVLTYHESCILNLNITGQALTNNVDEGPTVCQRDSLFECYQPSSNNSLKITIAQFGSLALTANASNDAEVNVLYSQTNVASGGKAPYLYSLFAGTLPSGTTLDVLTGTVSGTPTSAGPFSYTIEVTDADGTRYSQASNGTIASALNLTSTPSSQTGVGVIFIQTNVASGGTSPYGFSLISGTLPAGTTLNASTGTVSGTPTTAGPFSYTIGVTDAAGATAIQASSGTIANEPTLGGVILGLSGTVQLQNNNGETLTLSVGGSFTFVTPLAVGSSYSVTVLTQPTTQTCSVTNGSGTMPSSNVTNVTVNCSTNAYSLEGTVLGLLGTLELQNNNANNLILTNNGSFEFATSVAQGTPYNVTVLSNPSSQTCTVTNGSDIMGGANVTNIMVNCTTLSPATLTPSVSNLALSIQCLPSTAACTTTKNAALTGNIRRITIQNTGSVSATNVSVSNSGMPSGTSVDSSNCGSNLAANSSCVINITPGSVASDVDTPCTSGTEPTGGTVTISADGGLSSQVTVYVLGYGCQYQGGFLYAVDDTYANYPISGSVGGSVVTVLDQAAPSLTASNIPQATSIIWTSNGTGAGAANVSEDVIPWISEFTTTTSATYAQAQSSFNSSYTNEVTNPFPLEGSFSTCQGAEDGKCNSDNILLLYNTYNTNYVLYGAPQALSPGPTNLSYYSIGLCNRSIDSEGNSPCSTGTCYIDWYLPAVCEYDAKDSNLSCSSGKQSMVSNLSFLIGSSSAGTPSQSCSQPANVNCLVGQYWSSTEYDIYPLGNAWYVNFDQLNATYQANGGKDGLHGARCTRRLTQP